MSLRVTLPDIDEVDDSFSDSMGMIYFKRAGRIVASAKAEVGSIDVCDGADPCDCKNWKGLPMFHGAAVVNNTVFSDCECDSHMDLNGKRTKRPIDYSKSFKITPPDPGVSQMFNLVPKDKYPSQKNGRPCSKHGLTPTHGCNMCDVPWNKPTTVTDDGKTYSEQAPPGAEPECVCEITAFGPVVRDECEWPHK